MTDGSSLHFQQSMLHARNASSLSSSLSTSSVQPVLSDSSSSIAPDDNMEYPVLLLTQQPDSHGFNERRIVLNDTVKVGRSVARARPSDTNAIFDCKVLSRNHAIIWFDSGKVWLRDTKSSNGTFVNNQLLSKGTEDSPPREIYSGDIVQFGVEVVENTTTHGCIIAQVSVYLPDGSELRRQFNHDVAGGIPAGGIPISNYYEEQIYQLAQYIQEASHREQTLEKKLNNLSQLIIDTQEASDSSWKVILNQDRLMEKLEMLQEQVNLYSKGDDPDAMTVDLRRVLEQRYGLERESKLLLEGLIQDKAEVLQRVVDLEQSLSVSEEECAQLRVAFEALQKEHGNISDRLANGKDEVDVLQRRLLEAQQEYNNEVGRAVAEKEELAGQYTKLAAEANELRARLEATQLELTDSQEQKAELRHNTDGGHLSAVHDIEQQLGCALVAEIEALRHLQQLEDLISNSEIDLDSFVIGTTSELALYFVESHRQIRSGLELTELLKLEIQGVQKSLGHPLNDAELLIEQIITCQSKTRAAIGRIPGTICVSMSGLLTAASATSHRDSADIDVATAAEQSAMADFDEILDAATAAADVRQDGQTQTDSSLSVVQVDSSVVIDNSTQAGICVVPMEAQTEQPYPIIDADGVERLREECSNARVSSPYKSRCPWKKQTSGSVNDHFLHSRPIGNRTTTHGYIANGIAPITRGTNGTRTTGDGTNRNSQRTQGPTRGVQAGVRSPEGNTTTGKSQRIRTTLSREPTTQATGTGYRGGNDEETSRLRYAVRSIRVVDRSRRASNFQQGTTGSSTGIGAAVRQTTTGDRGIAGYSRRTVQVNIGAVSKDICIICHATLFADVRCNRGHSIRVGSALVAVVIAALRVLAQQRVRVDNCQLPIFVSLCVSCVMTLIIKLYYYYYTQTNNNTDCIRFIDRFVVTFFILLLLSISINMFHSYCLQSAELHYVSILPFVLSMRRHR